MTVDIMDRFERLAESDATLAPLARLQRALLLACDEPIWRAAADFEPKATPDMPLLDGATLAISIPALASLWRQLLEIIREPEATAKDGVDDDLTSSAQGALTPATFARLDPAAFDLLSLMGASIAHDLGRVHSIAAEAHLQTDAGLFATLGQLAAMPLLVNCARGADPSSARMEWPHPYCPVCAAWPALAELRGLERERWLRCSRCGAGWRFPLQKCAYCGNNDHRTLGYLAADKERDTRRAETCQRCGGYLKTLATLAPLTLEDIIIEDMTTLELDLAALDREYVRPEASGFSLRVTLQPQASMTAIEP